MEDIEEQVNNEEEETNKAMLRKVEVKLSPKYDVPLCYVSFFDNKKHKPKEAKEGNEGEEDAEEESESDDEDVAQNKKKGVKFAGNGEKPNVIVMVKQRTKRKNTTTISNLEPWNVDIKELTKHIKKKMAIGCSTTKTATGQQIVIQGDAGEQVINLLKSEFHIPLKSISAIRKVKKAPEPKQPAAQPVYELGGSSSDDDDDDNDIDEVEDNNNENHTKNRNEGENQEEEDTEFENPNRPSKKNRQHQNQQHENHKGNDNEENNGEDHQNQHHENHGRGGFNRGGRGRGRGGNNRGGRGRGGNNRGGRGRGHH